MRRRTKCVDDEMRRHDTYSPSEAIWPSQMPPSTLGLVPELTLSAENGLSLPL
jgi:hypothetical protein